VSTPTLLLRTVRAELVRLRTVRTTWWLLAVATLMLIGMGALLGFEAAADPPEVRGGPAWETARFIMMPTQFVFLGLVILAITSDYATGGIVPSLQWTPRRSVLFVARTLVTVAVATGVGLLLAIGSSIATRTTAGSALTLGLGEGHAQDMVGRVGFVLLCGTTLAVGLGFLLRNTAGALISVFLLILVLPLLLPVFSDWLDEVAQRLPGSGAIYLLTEGPDTMTTTSSMVVLAAWAVAALAAGWVRFARTDANR
jgi:ABC-2 type transport system permease protein